MDSWRARTLKILAERDLTMLAIAVATTTIAAALFLLSAAIPRTCGSFSCTPLLSLIAGVLSHAGFVAFFLGLAAGGSWIASLAHQTWRERLHLEALTLAPSTDGEQAATDRLLAIGAGDHSADPILARGRQHLWIGCLVGLFSFASLPPAIGTFLDADSAAGFLLPISITALAISLGSVMRGAILLRGGRRLLHRYRSEAGMPAKKEVPSS